MRVIPVFLALILLLTGCWDMKEAQNINFITALGVDYENGRFVIYAQLLDFSDIAKQEGAVETGHGEVWIGKSEGRTIDEALISLYPASQQRTSWTHVRTIIFSKALLDKHLPEAVNGLIQTRDLRYTPWVFGTDQKLPDILKSISLLNESVLNSALLDPEELFKLYSYVEPLRLIKLMDGVKEPAVTKLLPLVSWTEGVWKGDGEPTPQVKLVGAYAIAQGKNRGLVDSEMLQGARYVKFRRMISFPLPLVLDEGAPVTINIAHRDPDIQIGPGNDPIRVNLNVRAKAYITELAADSGITSARLRAAAAETIEREIRRSFDAAKAKQIDLYNLEEMIYRHDQERWKKLRSQGKPLISIMELDQVHVEVNLIHSSSHKVLKQ
ncbi:germination protein, Ger(x)C family [Paenibacillus barengoltzii J12]|uniref:Germination protein, Ger(X)C family n=1 Tax=Paenibacillus barengoltzii J12 TaxID=935846 RepID=A0ABY1M1K0_9BACL|nr:germination protein, Ger(x)C family [Paenibacillus barengoltzii]SMF54945.1 germination protein, Ger(x)C family [Paenibacillus barengoltzii J12]